ncbi:YihY/virulence factor BrkB family protein [Baekduia soli]|uniref:YihY/virulence factor BrkB family protein n=1 Tax=Baekduia soli TaxID=496014 RepID=A0A5B8TZF8_9ACTN|nr:YihY/virulence factor BrkB family protein [Baekduia soli]QEC46108.1 YihY/virulence factor BrkB family protein [Baekduia soli]QEC50588.1 YihY/virulence factor BrkB family protein [Baekduia soli]
MARETSERRFVRDDDARAGREAAPGPDDDRSPHSPTDLPARSWTGVLKRTVSEFKDDNLTDWAAALTYYGVLAIFPALIALVSIIGLVGPSATQPVLDNLAALTPGPANDILSGAVKQIAGSRGGAGIAFVAGIAAAIWSASGYVGAFARASNAIYEVPEGRPFWKLRPMQLIVTTIMVLLLAASAVAVVVTGPVADQLGSVVGAGSAAVTAWDIAKWPAIAAVVSVMFSILYYAAPNVKQPAFRWITVGGMLALVVLLAASALFAIYVANFSSYNKTYGTLGGVVAFLVWLWISNIAVLLGAELNAELERGRELEAGLPAQDELQLPLRDDRKLKD